MLHSDTIVLSSAVFRSTPVLFNSVFLVSFEKVVTFGYESECRVEVEPTLYGDLHVSK